MTFGLRNEVVITPEAATAALAPRDMTESDELLDHPIIAAAIAEHGLTVELAVLQRARDPMRRIILPAGDGRPAITGTGRSVTVNRTGAAATLTRLRDGRLHAVVTIVGSLPAAAVMAAEGKSLDRLVDMPGAADATIVSAWEDEEKGVVMVLVQ